MYALFMSASYCFIQSTPRQNNPGAEAEPHVEERKTSGNMGKVFYFLRY
jgi:hypothetical protein